MRSSHPTRRAAIALDDEPCDRGAERDAPLTQEVAAIDRELRDLCEAERPWLIRFFKRQGGPSLRNEADDLAHEAVVRFLRVAPTTKMVTPQAYLRRIAINLLRDRAERGTTRLAHISVPLVEGLHRPIDFDQHRELEARQELAHYEAVLHQLKPRTLEVFLLSRVDGYSYKEIGTRLGISVWSVKRDMLKAIAHLDRNRREW